MRKTKSSSDSRSATPASAGAASTRRQAKFPSKKYEIIYADPPWSYRDKALNGQRGACCKYEVQSQDWLRQLPVAGISATDCILFLWVTMPKLDEVFGLIESWGFTYKTVAFTWVKRNRKSDSWFWGMGRWTRANAELCLLCTKGNPKRLSASVSSVIDSPIEEHSKKPSCVRDRIIQLVGNLPRIELFARQQSEGWDSWGNELCLSPEESNTNDSVEKTK